MKQKSLKFLLSIITFSLLFILLSGFISVDLSILNEKNYQTIIDNAYQIIENAKQETKEDIEAELDILTDSISPSINGTERNSKISMLKTRLNLITSSKRGVLPLCEERFNTVAEAAEFLKANNMPVNNLAVSFFSKIEKYKIENPNMVLADVLKFFDKQFAEKDELFAITASANVYDVFTSLTDAEKALVVMHPVAAVHVNTCRNKAVELEQQKFGSVTEDTVGDAFRHTTWNALMTNYIGKTLANSFATAHEERTTEELKSRRGQYYEWQRRDMDLHNNSIGRTLISSSEENSTTILADATIRSRVEGVLTNNIYGAYWLDEKTQQSFTADVNGDGREDVILARSINNKRAFSVYLAKSNGTFNEPITTQSTRTFIAGDPSFIGDINGDGRADMIVHWATGEKRQLLVYLGKADGSFNEATNLSSTRSHDPVSLPTKFFIDDVNGDGKDDFIVHWKNNAGKRCILVYKGKATSPYFEDATSDALTSTNIYIDEDPVFTGDVNGDGRADMIVHWSSDNKRQLLVYTANSNGTYNTSANLSSIRIHNPTRYPSQFFVSDANGDGKDDFIVLWKNDSGKRSVLVYKGKSTSPYFEDASSDALVSTNNYVATDPAFVGDVNGDGRSDIVVHWAYNGKRQLLVYSAKTTGTFNAGVNFSSTRTHNIETFPCQLMLAKSSNDLYRDFIVKWKNNNTISLITYCGTSTGTFTEGLSTTPTLSIPYSE